MTAIAGTWERVQLDAPLYRRALEVALFLPGAIFWALVMNTGALGLDGRLYRDGAAALLAGQDPYAASVMGWHLGSPPVTLVAMVPFGLLPEWAFTPLWLVICAASAVVIVRALRLPLTWLLFPPLVMGWFLGSPALPGMALVLTGPRWLGVVLRPQLAVPMLAERRWRTLALVGLAGVLCLAVAPGWLGRLPELAGRYSIESGPSSNAWGTIWLLPVLAAIMVLARRDLELAAWLVVPAVFPALGVVGLAMVMRARSLPLAAAVGMPFVPLAVPAIVAYSLWRGAGPSVGASPQPT